MVLVFLTLGGENKKTACVKPSVDVGRAPPPFGLHHLFVWGWKCPTRRIKKKQVHYLGFGWFDVGSCLLLHFTTFYL